MTPLTTYTLLARGYVYDFDLDRNDQPCHSYSKNGLSIRDRGYIYEVKGQEIDTVEELEAIEANSLKKAV